MNGSMGNVDVNAVINVAGPIVLEVIAWFRRRVAEGKALPDDAEVVAYVKGKLANLVAEADMFEAEGDGSLKP